MRALGDWQSARLAQTYADLAAESRYRDAIAFFRSDLYGGEQIAQRDADLARAVPMMSKALPDRVIATVAMAMELNVLSQELDRRVLHHLPGGASRFSVADYCRAYRNAGEPSSRRRQIALIGEVGRALDVYVKKPMLRRSLAMMRRPAQLAGFGTLHDFLERGFAAFARMRGADEFLAIVDMRETSIHEAIVRGVDDPFPDPLDPLPS